MCWWVINFFVIFAVLDVSFAVNSCLNRIFLHLLQIKVAGGVYKYFANFNK